MIKSKGPEGTVLVTFTLPAAAGALRASVCGEWNEWSPDRHRMDEVEGGFVLTVALVAGRSYRFRYLVDGTRWENDWNADRYEVNGVGGDDSVVDLSDPIWAGAGAGSTGIEREMKVQAPAGFEFPDWRGLPGPVVAVEGPVRRLAATYYDTADLRLARSGVTVRHRGGEDGPPWTVKLPEPADGSGLARREVRMGGPAGAVPEPAVELVLATTRGSLLTPVAHLDSVRRPVELVDDHGTVLVEVVDDTVRVEVVDDTVRVSSPARPLGGFREVEVERKAEGPVAAELAEVVVQRLIDAGCRAEPPLPKLVRALGPPARRPPEVVVPGGGTVRTIGEVIHQAMARSVAQLVRHDPGARLGDDLEDVHKLRVATRRLRSDLHSFSPLLAPETVSHLRRELAWVGRMVGPVRDVDVLGARLAGRLADLRLDGEGAAGLRLQLQRDDLEARTAMRRALGRPRYVKMLDQLVELAAGPPLVGRPQGPARSRAMAARMARKPWRRLAKGVHALGPNPPDAELHRVRILAKRSRYALEAVATLLGPEAVRLAAAVADLQAVLGDHHDTVVAEAWLRALDGSTATAPATVRQLINAERDERAQLRARWPDAWARIVALERPFSD